MDILFRSYILVIALVTNSSLVGRVHGASTGPTKETKGIPWSEVGAKAGADYKGDGLSVMRTENGARLRCVFQRLEGDVTSEGLWLTSTLTNGVNERFRVVASAVGRRADGMKTLARRGTVSSEGQTVRF